MPLFDPSLGLLDLAADHAAFNRLSLLHAKRGENALHPVAREDAHEVVVEREEEPAGTGISLAARASAQLEVNAAGLVPFCPDDMQAPQFGDLPSLLVHPFRFRDLAGQGIPLALGDLQARGVGVLQLFPRRLVWVPPQDDVGAAARHIGGDGHSRESTGLGNDVGFPFVVLGVQHFVLDAPLPERPAQRFGALNRDGPHQDGPAGLVDLADLIDHRLVLFGDRAIDDVGVVDPLHGTIRGDGHHLELVDLPELARLGHGGSGHAPQLAIQLEVVLQRDGREGLVLGLDLDPFLRLDRLVEAVAPLPPLHQPARELVDDHNLAVHRHVVHVPLVEMVGPQRVVNQVRPFHVPGGVEALDPGGLLGKPDPFFGQVAGVLFLFDLEVHIALQLAGNAVGLAIAVDIVVSRARDDERGPGFVDQDVVDFVNHRVDQRALHLQVARRFHVVAQVVEPKLVVRPVGDVAGVRLGLVFGLLVGLDAAHRQPQPHVQRAHPLHVAAGQVVVDRHDVHVAGQGVQKRRQRRHQRLPFAGHHLGDHSLVQHVPADHLHVVMPHL